MVTENKTKKPQAPNPAFYLLTAVNRAIKVGVERGKITPIVDMAIQASKPQADGSARKQADIWRNCAGTLNDYSDEVSPPEKPSPPSASA